MLPEQCERARSWTSLRVDGEFSGLQSALLDAHLRRCRGCRAFARGTEDLAAALASARLEGAVQLARGLPPPGGRVPPALALRPGGRLRALGPSALAAGAVAGASVAATLAGVSAADGTAQ